MATRDEGMLAPASPAWIVTLTPSDATSTPTSRARDAMRSAYVGVASSTVAPTSRMFRTRCSVVIAPPEIASAPTRSAPANADQKPINGPNENAKNTRSDDVTPAARYTWSDQIRNHHSHDSCRS